MSKSSKVMIIVMVSVLAICIAAIAGVSIANGRKAETPTNEESISEISTTQSLASQILGKWSDSSGMSGFEFFADNTVNVTYVNLTIPVVNIPISGSAKGTYVLNGDSLSVHYSIYSATIDVYFTASIEGNTLKLVDAEDNDTYTYMRVGDAISTTSAAATNAPSSDPVLDDQILGAWRNSDSSAEYVFYENGTVDIKLFGSGSKAEYSGVYTKSNNDGLIVQYTTKDNQRVTNEYTVTFSGQSMTLVTKSNDTIIFVRTAGASSLLGKWKDSAGMSGYEFKEDGTVDVTYINLVVPVINIPINGTFSGTYSVDGEIITINYSIYSNAISNKYHFEVSGSTLTLTNISDSEVSTYIKATPRN